MGQPRDGHRPQCDSAVARLNDWWDNPGRPTPYLLWGILWCHCGTTMVPLDRCAGGTDDVQRFYRCDAGCGRRPVPAAGVESEVLRAVAVAAASRFPQYTLRGWWARRLAATRGHPERRRHLIRDWVCRVTVAGGQPPQLHWQQRPSEGTGPAPAG